jgi:para-nitrobenzyl esterase
MWTWARLHATTIKNKVFFYRFDQAPPFPENSPRAGWGASHFAELWYMSDHLNQEPWRWTAADHRLADAMSSYWANFVKNGNPNGGALPQWPEFKSDSGPIMILSDPTAPGAIDNMSRLQTFDQVYTQLRQMPLR